MRKLVAVFSLLALAGCGARPVLTDSLRGPNPVLRTRNYTRPELEDLKNRGHTYLADIKTTRRAVLALCRANRLAIERDADWAGRGAAQILTGKSSIPARPVRETVRLIDKNFDDVKLTRGRYWIEIGITNPGSHDRTNVVMREFFEVYDARTGRWLMRYIPPGLVTKALFKQLDRRIRVLKNTRELMWRNW